MVRHIDRFEVWAEEQERGPFRDWLLQEAVPMMRAREVGRARASRRWKGHEKKNDAEQRRAWRNQKQRQRERQAEEKERAISRDAAMAELRRGENPMSIAQANKEGFAPGILPKTPESNDPDRYNSRDFPVLRAKAFQAVGVEGLAVLERAESWPKDDMGFINLANRLEWSERRVIERAKACVASTLKWEAEHPEDAGILDV